MLPGARSCPAPGNLMSRITCGGLEIALFRAGNQSKDRYFHLKLYSMLERAHLHTRPEFLSLESRRSSFIDIPMYEDSPGREWYFDALLAKTLQNKFPQLMPYGILVHEFRNLEVQRE